MFPLQTIFGPFPLKCYRKVQDIHLKVTHLLNIRPQKRNKKLHVSFKNLSFGLEIFWVKQKVDNDAQKDVKKLVIMICWNEFSSSTKSGEWQRKRVFTSLGYFDLTTPINFEWSAQLTHVAQLSHFKHICIEKNRELRRMKIECDIQCYIYNSYNFSPAVWEAKFSNDLIVASNSSSSFWVNKTSKFDSHYSAFDDLPFI